MNFTKYTGLGNDFVFLDGQTALGVKDPFSLAVKICDRHFGVGGDGVVVIQPSKKADAGLRIFNYDGSDGEIGGNYLSKTETAVKLFQQAAGFNVDVQKPPQYCKVIILQLKKKKKEQ